MIRFFDASALVKRYVQETGSAAVRRLLTADLIAVSRLSEIEITSALMRQTREGVLSESGCEKAFAKLSMDFAALYVVDLTPAIAAEARALLRRHQLRAGDAIQLASVRLLDREGLGPIEFVVFDARLKAAAQREGITAVP